MEARLALRTLEERVRALAGRADALRKAATGQRQAQARELARRARVRREAETAPPCTPRRASWPGGRALAGPGRRGAGGGRGGADRGRGRTDRGPGAGALVGAEFESLVDAAHRDEMARAEQRMRVEALTEKVLAELGLEAGVLVAEYGPDQPVPTTGPDGEPGEPMPFVREQQQKRLRAAERDLSVLGRVNPLALEEFEAMEERHQFLATQLDDLRRTREDLMDIISEVDTRVQQVFAEAYADVEQAFTRVFARLFPVARAGWC